MATIMAPDLAQNMSSSRSMAHEVAPQADLAVKSKTAPVYQYVQQYQSNNGANVTLNNSAPTQSIWNLPGDIVWNFGKSYITLDLALTASTNVTAVQTDVVPIDSIQLQTASGTLLGALYNCQSYCKNILAITKPLDDYLAEGPVYAGASAAASFYSQSVCCQPSNALVGTAVATVVPTTQYFTTVQAAANNALNTAPYTQDIFQNSSTATDVNFGTDRAYLCKQRLAVAGAVGAGAAIALRYKIPFSAFLGTMLGANKDYLLGQNFQIVINWSAVNRFVSDQAAIALTGANTAYAGAGTMSNVYLWMAKEINADIVNELRAKVHGSGLEVLIPYTTCGKGSTSAGSTTVGGYSNYSLNQTLTAGMGLALKRILTVPTRITDVNGLANCNDNVNGHLYLYVQSFLDANPIQQVPLAAGVGCADYNYMAPMLKNVPAGLSVREFQINSFWLDNFSDSASSATEFAEDDCVDSGLRINDVSKNYNIVLGVSSFGGANLYQYVTFVRKLIIRPSGLSWGA